MQGFYINLEDANLRRNLIENQILDSKLLFDIKRFPALYGKDYPEKPSRLSNGQWGCWLSHVSTIQQSLENNDDLLILEDDEYFDAHLNHCISLTKSLENSTWDILFLDATIVEIEDYLFLSRKLDNIISSDSSPIAQPLEKGMTIYGTHAYIINNFSKNKILELLKRNIHTGLPIDNVYCAAIKEEKVNGYITLPFLASPGAETTNSQINASSHPLESAWIKFRVDFSIGNISGNYKEFKESNLIEKLTKETILKRLNFFPMKTFEPHQGVSQKLK